MKRVLVIWSYEKVAVLLASNSTKSVLEAFWFQNSIELSIQFTKHIASSMKNWCNLLNVQLQS